MLARMHRAGGETILAVCDEHLLGTVLEDGGRKISVGEFYNGTSVDADTLAEWMRSAGSMNLIGDEAVSVAVREGYASADSAFEIAGTKYLVVVMM